MIRIESLKNFIAGLSAIILFSGPAYTQENSWRGYYGPPLNIPLVLSGNFAETRTNHFHSGIDIKTEGVEGKPLYAVADGYISRIGIAPYGYGRVLYINHPNGTTSVYAHMQKFTEEVEEYVDTERHKNKVHRVELYPAAGKFSFKKGDLIGYAGNSGSSLGPHLHFEIRETATQRTVNTVKRGVYEIKDDIPPMIIGVYYIQTDTVNGVPVNSEPVKYTAIQTSLGKYTLSKEPVQVGKSGYFVVETTDRKNNTQNTFGVYRITLSMDGEYIFGFSLDSFLFANTRYVNSLMHYGLQRGSRNQFIRLAVQANNRIPIFYNVKNRGVIYPGDDGVHDINISIEDDSDNISTLDFRITASGTQNFTGKQPENTMILEYTKPFVLSADGMTFNIPARSLYESVFLEHSVEADPDYPGIGAARLPLLTPIYNIHKTEIPMHTAARLSIEVDDPGNLGKYLCIANLSDDGKRLSYTGGKFVNGRMEADVRNFGHYCVVADTIAPTVKPSFADGADLTGQESIRFDIADNFSGIAGFSATIDGKWIPLEHNTMKSYITHEFNPRRIEYKGTEHQLVLTVTDNAGNSITIRRKFKR